MSNDQREQTEEQKAASARLFTRFRRQEFGQRMYSDDDFLPVPARIPDPPTAFDAARTGRT